MTPSYLWDYPSVWIGLMRLWLVLSIAWACYWTLTNAPRNPFDHMGCGYRVGFDGPTQQQFMYDGCWTADEAQEAAEELAGALNESAMPATNIFGNVEKPRTETSTVFSQILSHQRNDYQSGTGALLKFLGGLVRVPALIAALFGVGLLAVGWVVAGFMGVGSQRTTYRR